jgi:hypothetical protein
MSITNVVLMTNSEASAARPTTSHRSGPAPTNRPKRPVPVRGDKPPVDQRDFDDRHETRATGDDSTMRRYILLSWHRTAQRLVPVVVLAAIYIGLILVLARNVPGISARDASLIVSSAFGVAGGGYGAVAAGQAVVRRRRGKTTPVRK